MEVTGIFSSLLFLVQRTLEKRFISKKMMHLQRNQIKFFLKIICKTINPIRARQGQESVKK